MENKSVLIISGQWTLKKKNCIAQIFSLGQQQSSGPTLRIAHLDISEGVGRQA